MPKRDQSTKDSKSVTLYAKSTDGNSTAYPVKGDLITGALITIDYAHAEIHCGDHLYKRVDR